MAIRIRRREFIATLVGTVAAGPIAVQAQKSAKVPTIGWLGTTTPSSTPQRTAAFVQRLGELGWSDGQTVTITYRWAQGRDERSAEIAEEFVRLNVAVIVTSGMPAVLAARRATSIIPIVFGLASDPVGNGLVGSLAHPGGNVTGLSNQSLDLGGKRIQFLREVVPALRHLAIIANVANPDPTREMHEVETAARALGLDVVTSPVRRSEDIALAFEAFKNRAEALYVVSDPLINANSARIQTLAMGARLPTIYNTRDFVEVGGLMSYGADYRDLWRRAAEIVNKILRGTQPADIPIEQPTKFELVINRTTAKVLGLTIPESFLLLADEVIE
jgi:putative tryptophan/tyrosine transport system substrate-binding protein